MLDKMRHRKHKHTGHKLPIKSKSKSAAFYKDTVDKGHLFQSRKHQNF